MHYTILGKPLSDLALAGANGSLYINIHTEQYLTEKFVDRLRIPLTKNNEYPKILILLSIFLSDSTFLICEMLVRFLPVQPAYR
jgi:hypothetical protein